MLDRVTYCLVLSLYMFTGVDSICRNNRYGLSGIKSETYLCEHTERESLQIKTLSRKASKSFKINLSSLDLNKIVKTQLEITKFNSIQTSFSYSTQRLKRIKRQATYFGIFKIKQLHFFITQKK